LGQVLSNVLRNFAGGVITARSADALQPTESPRGRNSALTLASNGQAVVAKRHGASVYNTTPISGSPAVLGQYAYRKFTAAGSYTLYHLAVSDNGRLDAISSIGAAAAADASTPTPFTSGTYLPDFATSNNLCFMVNTNGDAKKFNGTSVQNFGITRPTVGTMALADSGIAGSPNGTYEGRVTFYNSVTGQESSISNSTTATVTVASKKINWSNIPVSSDTQVTSRRLYIRNTSTMTNFYLAATISDNTSTTAVTNNTDASLVTLGPDTAENDPPPSGVRLLASHLSRLFASDGVSLYFSKVGFPESFDPDNTEAVNANDSDQITGIHSAHEILIVFKRTQIYGLFGDDPDAWTIRLISSDIGCVSQRSIRTVEGVTYWWSLKGPMAWDGTGLPKAIGTPSIGPSINSTSLAFGSFDKVCTEADSTNERVMFAVPETGQTRNTLIFPFNYRLGVWESDGWNPFDTASMAAIEDANKIPWVMIGSYSGQVFKWWDATSDAIPSGTTSGTVTSATSTTVTDSTAAFPTTGGKLIDRYVYLIDPTGTVVQRKRITGNTATVLTVDSSFPIDGTVTGYTYAIGTADFSWDTPWLDLGQPFFKKRYEYLYTQFGVASVDQTIYVDLFKDFDDSNAIFTTSFTTTNSSGVWDTSLWDSATWGGIAAGTKRTRIGRTGRFLRLRYRNRTPDQIVTLYKVGIRAELLTDRN
jgi:hypothetical protein